jgi:hypothetical protein
MTPVQLNVTHIRHRIADNEPKVQAEPQPPIADPTPSHAPDLGAAPTNRELDLARQVRDLQKDRDELQVRQAQHFVVSGGD